MTPRRLLPWSLRALLVLPALACQGQPAAPGPGTAPGRGAAPVPAATAPPASAEQVDLLVDAFRQLLGELNRDRREASVEAPALKAHPVLQAVVQEYVAELSRQDRLPPSNLSRVLIDRLNGRGYKAYRVAVGYAQIGGSFDQALAAWREGDPGAFERLLNPELRDFALGVGELRGAPFYLAVGAVRQSDHYEEESADLRGDLEKARQEELRLVNARRAEDRLRPFSRHPTLDLVAQAYAEDMLARDFYGHFSPEGKDVGDRVRASRYPYYKVGENVASGQSSVEAVVQGWIDSPEHLRNLLDRDFREIGIGFAAGPSRDGSYRFLWVQVFAAPR